MLDFDGVGHDISISLRRAVFKGTSRQRRTRGIGELTVRRRDKRVLFLRCGGSANKKKVLRGKVMEHAVSSTEA